MPFLPPNQQRQSTEGTATEIAVPLIRSISNKKREGSKNVLYIRPAERLELSDEFRDQSLVTGGQRTYSNHVYVGVHRLLGRLPGSLHNKNKSVQPCWLHTQHTALIY